MESVIWGKNRHFFGGIAPSNMRRLTAKISEADGSISVIITALGPESTVNANGQILCTSDKFVLRRSTIDYPKDEFDGDLVCELSSDTTHEIVDNDVEGGMVYYYAAFPYSKQGVYNRNKANRVKVDLTEVITYTYLFGYDLDLDDSNPSTRVTYPSDVDNHNYVPAAMNYTDSVFDYGGWNITPGEKFMPRPCMLKYDGTVDHYLNPDNYTKKIDGTNSSVKSSSFEGNAMMEWPKIYTKRWEDEDGIYHFRCSDAKIDDDWDCWCNYDINNNEIDHFYTAIYGGIKDSNNKIRSLSLDSYGSKLSSEYFFDYAKNNGADWHLETTADFLLIQDLLVMMAKTTHTQNAYGRGNSSSENTFIKVGTMNTKGLFWGTRSWSEGVKVFGMEHWWGNGARMLAGWLYKMSASKYYIKATRGTKDGTTCTDYNYTGTGYLQSPAPGSKYCDTKYHDINDATTTPYGRLVLCSDTVTAGSSTTFETDAAYWEYDTSNVYCATVGGNADMGDGNGAFQVAFNVRSGYGAYAKISCKPSAIV